MKINSGQSFYRKPALPTWFTNTAFSCSKVMDKTIGEKLDKTVAIDKNHGPACIAFHCSNLYIDWSNARG